MQAQRPSYRNPRYTPPTPGLLRRMARKGLAVTIISLLVALLLFIFMAAQHRSASRKHVNGTAGAQMNFNKKALSTTNAASLWVVVNKPLPLSPINYQPSSLVVPHIALRDPGEQSMQLRPETAAALERLVAGAKAAGFDLMLSSGYRSYDYQVGLYNGYVRTQGQADADKTSARPGHSEHQTGLAADLAPVSRQCEVETCFGDMPEGKWLAANAYKYGFIIRYPADKVSITGYDYEPWHVRYVGTSLANELHRTGIATLEEFFGVKGGKEF